jgi:hypothetical protein
VVVISENKGDLPVAPIPIVTGLMLKMPSFPLPVVVIRTRIVVLDVDVSHRATLLVADQDMAIKRTSESMIAMPSICHVLLE